MTERSNFGEIIKKTLDDMSLQQNDLAERMGKRKNYVSALLRTDNPSTSTLISVADALDCSVDYLLGRTDNPQSHTDKEILSSDEQDLLEIYRNFNDKGKVALKTQAGILSTVPLYTKENQMNWRRMLWETFMKSEQWNLKTLKNI